MRKVATLGKYVVLTVNPSGDSTARLQYCESLEGSCQPVKNVRCMYHAHIMQGRLDASGFAGTSDVSSARARCSELLYRTHNFDY